MTLQIKGTPDTPFRINDLPPELISLIFEIVFFESHHPESHYWKTYCYCFFSSLTISQVCQNWRWISVSNPLLWTHVLYLSSRFHTHFSSLDPGSTTPVSLCLDRSGSLPLSVAIFFEWYHDSPSSGEHANVALSRLLKTAGRWSSLVIWSFESQSQTHLDMFVDCTRALLFLRHLEIHKWGGEGTVNHAASVLAELPSLVSLRLRQTRSTILLPWNQIRRLTAEDELTSLQVLRCSSEVCSVDLSMLQSRNCLDGPVSSASIRVTEALQQLTVSPRLSPHFCNAIRELPGLKCFSQGMSRFGAYNDYRDFLQNSLCSILSKAPLLQELHLSFSWFDWVRNFESIHFGTLLHNIKLFRLTFVLREREYYHSSPKANHLLDMLFGPPNKPGIDGVPSTSLFPFPHISEFKVLLRIDPWAMAGGYGSYELPGQEDRTQLLTQHLLRILSRPGPQCASCYPRRTFELEYDAPLQSHFQRQLAPFQHLQAENKWETVSWRVLPNLIVLS